MGKGKFITKAQMIQIWNLYYRCNMKQEYIAFTVGVSPMTVYRAVKIMEAAVNRQDVDAVFGYNNNKGMKHFAKEIFNVPDINNSGTITLTKAEADNIRENLAKLYSILKETATVIEQFRLLLK